MVNNNFIFLGDALLLDNEPIEIIDNHLLKRANSNQIKVIKTNMPNDETNRIFTRYEYELKENNFLKLEEKDWKYWIIEYSSMQLDENIRTAIMLSRADLNPLFQIIYTSDENHPGKLYNPYHIYNYLSDYSFDFSTKKVCQADLDEIKDIFKLINDFLHMKDDYKYIYKSLSDYNNLKLIGKRSTLKIVALFSIVESIIVSPKKENRNFTTYQLKTKLNFLNNNVFKNKIDFRQYFKGPDTLGFETIIKCLYSYRSDIAHGDYSDFQKELQVIADPLQSYDFLYILLKEIIVNSLRNPQFIDGIKNC